MIFPSIVFAQPIESIQEYLSPWNPISIETSNGIMTVVLDENEITNTIFSTVIKNGICMPIWQGDTNALNGINEVTVLNKSSHQGYVFQGGKDICVEMGRLTSDKSEIYLFGNSRIRKKGK